MNQTNQNPALTQVALTVLDLQLTELWFREGLGFLPSGGERLMTSSPLAAMVQGLPGVASCSWWMVGRNPWFQIELFQFQRPVSQLLPADFRPCDIGYTRMGVWVADFDATLARLARLGTPALTPPLGQPGQRRVCVRSPDGVYVEIMEDDPLPQAPGVELDDCSVALRSVTLSTPDLEASVAYLAAVNGKQPENLALHTQEHEALWQLPSARCKCAVFTSGDILVEVVQYLDPPGKPWPQGYRLSDQGILNIAYGTRTKHAHESICQNMVAAGAQPVSRTLRLPSAGVVYFNDKLGFSVELMWISPGKQDRQWGFLPTPIANRPGADTHSVSASVSIVAPPEVVWKALNEHDEMAHWIGFPHVRRVRDGAGGRNGVGSERRMSGPLGTVVEQVTGIVENKRIRYRVIEGSPFKYHQGEVTMQADGAGTQLRWTIRFRSRLPFAGVLWRVFMQRMLDKMLRTGLRPYVERHSARLSNNLPQRSS